MTSLSFVFIIIVTKRLVGQVSMEQCRVDPEVTTIGYMPIVQSPAHEFDTLNTAVVRCKHIANSLGQQHVVLTEALYCKLMELKWAKQ